MIGFVIASAIILLLFKLGRSLIRKNKLKDLNFRGKTVLITGGSTGIGEALTYLFDKCDAGRIILVARNTEQLERVRKNCSHPNSVELYPCDLSCFEESSKEFAQKYANADIDIVIHNAGVSMRTTCLENAFENDKYLMNLNFFAPVLITKILLPAMLKRKSGHFVIISSLAGKVGVPLRNIYSGSKHAITGYFDSLRSEVTEENIKVSIICPGYVKTDISKNALLAKAGERLGKTDSNIGAGINVNEFAQTTIESIFLEEEELIVGRFIDMTAVVLRNLWPQFVFWSMARNKQNQLRAIAAAK